MAAAPAVWSCPPAGQAGLLLRCFRDCPLFTSPELAARFTVTNRVKPCCPPTVQPSERPLLPAPASPVSAHPGFCDSPQPGLCVSPPPHPTSGTAIPPAHVTWPPPQGFPTPRLFWAVATSLWGREGTWHPAPLTAWLCPPHLPLPFFLSASAQPSLPRGLPCGGLCLAGPGLGGAVELGGVWALVSRTGEPATLLAQETRAPGPPVCGAGVSWNPGCPVQCPRGGSRPSGRGQTCLPALGCGRA